MEEKAEGREGQSCPGSLLPAEATAVRDAPSLALAYFPLGSPGGAGTTCGHSCLFPVSSWGDQVSLHQETKGEGNSWVPSPRSQAFLCQGAKLPSPAEASHVPHVSQWPDVEKHPSPVSFLYSSAVLRGGRNLIQPCWRLRELRPCCSHFTAVGWLGIHELNRGLCHHSQKQLLSLKVAPKVVFSLLKHQLR